MNQKLTVAIAVFAGFVGGVLSQCISLSTIHAQSPLRDIISAQSFDLVDEAGTFQGGFMASSGKIYFVVREHSATRGSTFRLTDLVEALSSRKAAQ